ncbi:oxygenase MpaB family protein [Nocardiopsis algeriensis]|uniref:Uncharacterized protein (DUF2236 family) n=1 Tax=Nocardiopsis algeriensis TaxID=1478215 RepID=A0A841IXQ1_9ACTN|nr:oxygenase MpaB family protein [Nocardiopsis algeriensis]MBB6122056.1 uncharacterized protein (DUF2236 family) [Nocardiopsis algeriensis]
MVRSSRESPLRQVTAEASLLGGAGYAVLLQIAHPSVARGVGDHSTFATRPFARLIGTLYYVYGTVYGTDAERERLHAIVRAMHKKVTGPGYRALDDDLLLWVAATLCHQGARLYGMTMGGLDDEEYAAYVREAAVLGTALGLSEEAWPTGPAEFDAYWAEQTARLKIGDEAREITRQLFHPQQPLLRILMPLQQLLTTGLLSPEMREAFGLPWSDRRQRVFDAVVATTRTVYPRLPRSVRTLPATLCLRSMRRNGGWVRPRRRGRGSGRVASGQPAAAGPAGA